MKTVLKAVAIMLAAVGIAYCIGLGITGNANPRAWFGTEQNQPENPSAGDEGKDPVKDAGNGGTVISEGESNGVQLLSAELPKSAYSLYGVSAQAETAYLLTATVEPSNLEDKSVDWSVAWKNPESSFASGKAVTDYVNIIPTSDGALTATAECYQAFGEQIEITVTPRRASEEIKATCKVDYNQKIVGYDFNLNCTSPAYNLSLNYKSTEVVTDYPSQYGAMGWFMGLGVLDNCSYRVTANYSDIYTLECEKSETAFAYINYSSEYLEALKVYGFNPEFTANQDYTFVDGTVAGLFFTSRNASVDVSNFDNNMNSFLAKIRGIGDKVLFKIVCGEWSGGEVETVYNIKFSSSSIQPIVTNINLDNSSIAF